MSDKTDLIVRALLQPMSLFDLSPLDWDLLIRQGRSSNLLAQLASKLYATHTIDNVPQAARYHLTGAHLVAKRQEEALRREVEHIRIALTGANTKVTLLKGAAYAMTGLTASEGRVFSDIDILVPKSRLDATEQKLKVHGWQGAHHDEYDQRYYRQWMHEIPPMRHIRRETTIDVHHTILPETARVKVNTVALLDAIVPLPGHDNLYVLQPTDMLLHSATHLFHEGDFEKGLRDLFDLDALLREFGAKEGFWDQLVPRAVILGLTRPLYYALRYTTLMLDTPVPEAVVEAAKIGKPFGLVAALMDACYLRALRPVHASTTTFGTWPARFALYVRSHWIRMPIHLLAFHLGRKAFLRPKSLDEEKSIADADQKNQGTPG